VLVFWVADQAATYPKLAQAFDDFNSGAPAIELQFLLRRPNLNVLLWRRAHNAGWHMRQPRVTGIPVRDRWPV